MLLSLQYKRILACEQGLKSVLLTGGRHGCVDIVWYTFTCVIWRIVWVEVSVNTLMVQDMEQFLESFIDEDKSDQTGKRFFCKTGNVAHLHKSKENKNLLFSKKEKK